MNDQHHTDTAVLGDPPGTASDSVSSITGPAPRPKTKTAPAQPGWKGTGGKNPKPADLVDLAAVMRDGLATSPAGPQRQARLAAIEAVLFDPPALALLLSIVGAGSGDRPGYDASLALAQAQLDR